MCHASVLAWVEAALQPADANGKNVLEVGALNINGTARPIVERLEPASYLGVDMRGGPGVDLIVNAADLAATFGDHSFDLIISTEMLEHVPNWQLVLQQMLWVLRPGGLLMLTTRAPGFPHHGYPEDHWRFSVETIREIAECAGLTVRALEEDPEAPGVFLKAWRPRRKTWEVPDLAVWDGIVVDPAP